MFPEERFRRPSLTTLGGCASDRIPTKNLLSKSPDPPRRSLKLCDACRYGMAASYPVRIRHLDANVLGRDCLDSRRQPMRAQNYVLSGDLGLSPYMETGHPRDSRFPNIFQYATIGIFNAIGGWGPLKIW